jgi:hypothetical protein
MLSLYHFVSRGWHLVLFSLTFIDRAASGFGFQAFFTSILGVFFESACRFVDTSFPASLLHHN